MPIFDYQCASCLHIEERMVKSSDVDTIKNCNLCQGDSYKIITGIKGYKTDALGNKASDIALGHRDIND